MKSENVARFIFPVCNFSEMSESDMRKIEMEIEYEEAPVEKEIHVPVAKQSDVDQAPVARLLAKSGDTSQIDLPVSSEDHTISPEIVDGPLDSDPAATTPIATGVQRSKESKVYVRKAPKRKVPFASSEAEIIESVVTVLCDDAPKDINLDSVANESALKRQSMLKISFN